MEDQRSRTRRGALRNGMKLIGLEEHRETKVCALKRRVVVLVEEHEVVSLEIPVHHSHGVAIEDHRHDLAEWHVRSSGPWR